MKCSTNKTANERAVTKPDDEDTKLVRLARLGGYLGEQARTRLIQRHYCWIKQRCLYTIGNEADANDATQEVVLRMYRALLQFEGRSSIRTWLSTIVHHECVGLIRKRQRALLTDHMQALVSLYETDQRSHEAGVGIPRRAVHQALAKLPSQAKEVLQLRFYSELALEEMGFVLGISLSATKMRLYRALDQFKRIYQQLNNDEPVFA